MSGSWKKKSRIQNSQLFVSRRNSRHSVLQSHLTTELLCRRRREPRSHMTILILGGGFQQLPAIRKAYELGHTVLLADYLPNTLGRREADQSFLISTRDKDKIWSLPEGKTWMEFLRSRRILRKRRDGSLCGRENGPSRRNICCCRNSCEQEKINS